MSSPYAFADVAASTTAQVLVPSIPGKIIRVTAMAAMAGTTATSVIFGSKSVAGSVTVISMTYPCAINGGLVLPSNNDGWFETLTGEALVVTTGAGSTTGIQVVKVDI